MMRYYMVKDAYYRLMNNSNLVNLGIASDLLYYDFKQCIDGSNIGILYSVDGALKQKKFALAQQLLNSYSPQNLTEINTYGAYGKLIQYIETDSLSSSDSTFLNSIAQQNPAVGGQGIYIARNLLHLYIVDPVISTSSSLARIGTTMEDETINTSDYINVYPNPANNYYMIDIAGDYFAILAYELFSIDGRLILRGIINNKSQNRIDISKLESGVYFIKVFNDFELVYNSKLIKN